MNVSCPGCETVYRVDPAKVPQGGVRARCSACGGIISVGLSASSPDTHFFAPSGTMPAAPQARLIPAAPYVPQPLHQAPALQANRPTPFAQAPPIHRPTPQVAPMVTPISVPADTPPPRPAMGAPPAARPATVTPPAVRPAQAVPYAPEPNRVTPAAASTPAASQPVGDRRPVNLFLTRDPGTRARRLARALVSDMVAYYPAKHAEGLDKGTLKELFRDEIKKSYEEYTAQVGADFARTTTHFQESLNEVLGAGKKIF